MRHGSLFSGIGGFDLASEWMGWENIFHCEWNEFGQRVLKHHFPKSISYGDITTTDFTIHRGQIDILTGGFPCQPYSQAGKRLGKEDDRHLWPQMLRAIREIQPRWVVGENVLGLVNWNGGLVFDEVQADLENEGYVVQPYVLPACAVNAPHRRDRVWFVAYSEGNGDNGIRRLRNSKQSSHTEENRSRFFDKSDNNGKVQPTPNPNGIGCGGGDKQSKSDQSKEREIHSDKQQHGNGVRSETAGCGGSASDPNTSRVHELNIPTEPTEPKSRCGVPYERGDFSRFPTQSPICGGDDGLPTELDGITFSKWRNESVKAYGNAIVPQVAHQIFKAVEQYQLQLSSEQ
jgi:DNA (cytosine-5)-methyltransferase 1